MHENDSLWYHCEMGGAHRGQRLPPAISSECSPLMLSWLLFFTPQVSTRLASMPPDQNNHHHPALPLEQVSGKGLMGLYSQ